MKLVIEVESLVAQVLNKLKRREQQTYHCTYDRTAAAPSTQVFLDNATVTVANVSIELIHALYGMNVDNQWVAWVLQGIDYQVDFQFTINELAINFIPRSMLLDWPLLFVTPQAQPIKAVYPRLISRSVLAALPDKTIVVVTPQQRLTDEASTVRAVKQMKLQMRTDEECIWQK
ncbi:PduM family microcompartment protein [Levilactobacillus brevis]|uniref:PduM family microcompartment protein n=1 Tax=Levilactobacillus brevis TaxID=1580 RepID=UPI000B3FADB3|nr:PduM family microcompartment protein [Levilactobacillus brevis]